MVKGYNQKPIDTSLLPYLTDDKITNQAQTGKISFNDRKNENNQNEQTAIQNALTCYQDGIFKLFINDEEIEENTEITLKENDEITFIRLTMLSGRLW